MRSAVILLCAGKNESEEKRELIFKEDGQGVTACLLAVTCIYCSRCRHRALARLYMLHGILECSCQHIVSRALESKAATRRACIGKLIAVVVGDAEYAQVLRMLGNGRLEAFCIDGVKRLCHIRGKMRKKVWVNTVRCDLNA